ncbi:hypothetical protein FQV27_14040 [Paracoccus aurantiacus]|uniref:ATP-grasp domain-containing protein n=1 Tax=Paracoccus aurantiacus TaxID=2599412 RepID=A0A5C6RZK4_9RHOB|nr:hypothetical protein [Paracoccus aurantiacus]TXB67721.1 hypothetical protein FQV27_14040 [Paracoccus aurantiacus]
MLAFVLSEDHQYAVRDVLETRPHGLHKRIFILSYTEFLSLPELPVATYLFLDIERLTPPKYAGSIARLDALLEKRPDLRVLNRPDQIVDRMETMSRLHAAGINEFRLVPIDTPASELRFPVFLRGVQDHEGPKSQLLHNADELAAAIAALPSPRGYGITEYIDARNADGLHEKRSYMRIGDRLFPAARDVSLHWVCKGEYTDPAGVPQPEEEIAFLRGEQDMEVMRRAFDVAGIEYGRADYAVVNGHPQIFEINTNPWLEPPENVPAKARRGAQLIIDNYLDGLTALDTKSGIPRPEWVAVPGALTLPARILQRRSLVHKVLRVFGRLHWETRVMGRLRRMRIL